MLKYYDKGNQILINYRNTANFQQIAQQVTIRDVINSNPEHFDTAWVKDRVILIGVIAPSVKDVHYTPYGEMRSIYIHAHVTSQLLSTSENHYRSLWWIPEWGEFVWVFFWAFIGSVVVWQVKGRFNQGLILIILSTGLYVICWVILSFGAWIPVITPSLALFAPWGAIWVSNGVLVYFQTARNFQKLN